MFHREQRDSNTFPLGHRRKGVAIFFIGSTLFGTDEFSSVPFLYMMTIKKDNYPKKYTHGNCPKKGIKSS